MRSAGVSASDSELRASGRFSVINATRSRITQRSSLVPVSMVVSVVMSLPLLRHCEERSDEAIQPFSAEAFWIASLRSQ
ncbi:putative kinase [Bradyrhizobium sp. LM3.2]